MSRFQSRPFIGVILFCALLIMLVTSVIMFSKQHNALIALMHTLVGLLMVLVLVWHLIKNIRPLKHYLNPFQKHAGRFSVAWPLAICVIAYVGLAPVFQLAPAIEVYRFGQTLKAADKADSDPELKYVQREVEVPEGTGQRITVELKKGPYFLWPQYALWIESVSGEFVQPLYVTEKLATNQFTNKVVKKDPNQVFNSHLLVGEGPNAWDVLEGQEDPASKNSRMRPESLPVFLHQLNMRAENGMMVPDDDSLTIDGFSGATMTDNFIYTTRLQSPLQGRHRVRLEVNHSFDYNTYYSSDRFLDDPIYSGDGYSAQPSVIYEAIIDFDNHANETLAVMSLVGHGHHSGRNGDIYEDVSNLTTALELVERVIVSVN
ncbi:hypothetical protein [Pseudoalteromonas luteoviolacea]|uniref:hypothetical protein n=1 Tax=Pseudoalteromonas luteoviolacea TaxID=43657 RepID=UPI0007B092E7|nr:hypothetical protein [Pseudoalteromonas luteoviolacea]KZN56168.1 hypothetical protein N474_12875 [Pseudoalteromonas luteoviolacea CPMOR-2]TQF66767.1 hypothetical protein FLM44_24635 [Pseudoalteromonas luteoviolacea]